MFGRRVGDVFRKSSLWALLVVGTGESPRTVLAEVVVDILLKAGVVREYIEATIEDGVDEARLTETYIGGS